MGVTNDKQREFCRLLAGGKSKAEAYRDAYKSKGSAKTCSACAVKLLKNASVAAYLESLREEVKEADIADRQEILRFLTRILRTPVGGVDEDSDLCQEVTYGDQKKTVKMPSKITAVQEINRMMGHYEPEKVETTVSVVGSVLAGILSSPIIRKKNHE